MIADGIVVIDKPSGFTSHDVVAKVRKILGLRKVGHAGTLDPMATGMLVLGIGKGTRLLGHLTTSDKEYLATIRLGMSTDTDDAQGTELSRGTTENISDETILEVIRQYRGHILQKPSAVSAIKIAGQRAYARVRSGEVVDIPARQVTVHDLEVQGIEHLAEEDFIDVSVRVVCSAGTYIRALARDIGDQLEVGGHLTSLRRTRSGTFTQMIALAKFEESPAIISLADAVRLAFPTVEVSDSDAKRVIHGIRIPAPVDANSGVIGVFAPSGQVLSLSENVNSELVPVVVFANG